MTSKVVADPAVVVVRSLAAVEGLAVEVALAWAAEAVAVVAVAEAAVGAVPTFDSRKVSSHLCGSKTVLSSTASVTRAAITQPMSE